MKNRNKHLNTLNKIYNELNKLNDEMNLAYNNIEYDAEVDNDTDNDIVEKVSWTLTDMETALEKLADCIDSLDE